VPYQDIFYSQNDVSVQAKYVKGSPDSQLASNLKFGICAGMTSLWIRNMQKLESNPTVGQLLRTEPAKVAGTVTQSAYEKLTHRMDEFRQVRWLANTCQWDVDYSSVVGPVKHDIFKQLTSVVNVRTEWLLRVQIPYFSGDKHAVGVAVRPVSESGIDDNIKIEDQIVFYVYDVNYGLFQADPRTGFGYIARVYEGDWYAFKNCVNDKPDRSLKYSR